MVSLTLINRTCPLGYTNFIFSVYLLVFVVSSDLLYPLLSDSESDSEPEKLEGGGGMVFHLCPQALMRDGGRKKYFIIRGPKKNI